MRSCVVKPHAWEGTHGMSRALGHNRQCLSREIVHVLRRHPRVSAHVVLGWLKLASHVFLRSHVRTGQQRLPSSPCFGIALCIFPQSRRVARGLSLGLGRSWGSSSEEFQVLLEQQSSWPVPGDEGPVLLVTRGSPSGNFRNSRSGSALAPSLLNLGKGAVLHRRGR